MLTPFEGIRIADRVVIVTDGDKGTAAEGEPSPGIRRKTDLKTVAADAGAADLLEIFVNNHSLEPDLVHAGNTDLLKEVYVELHSRSEANWDAAIAKPGDEQARSIQELFGTTRKGDFAHVLAEKIIAGKAFAVPEYIGAAIEALVR